ADLVPSAWTDEDGAPRIRLANFSDGLGVNRVEHDCRGCVLGFVEQLERNVVGKLRVVPGDLAPERVELVGERGRIARELVEVLDVDDDIEAVLERIGDEEIGLGKNIGGKFEVRRGAGVMVPG